MEVQEYLEKYKNDKKFFSRSSAFSRFLWWCSGADRVLMESSPMKDRVKFAGLGGIVLATGVLAAVSGGYAFYTIFSPKGNAVSDVIHYDIIIETIIAGFVWGLIIFNLDRFIVSSTGKGDGTERMTPREWLNAIPRIIIALILGFVISTPLELRILETEIDAILLQEQKDFLNTLNKKTDLEANNQITIEKESLVKRENELREIEVTFEKLRIEINEKEEKLEEEVAGNIGSGRRGEGPAARRIENSKNRLENELKQLKLTKAPEIERIKKEIIKSNEKINEINQERDKNKTDNLQASYRLDGILKRIQISHEESNIWIAIWLTLLCIELGPIFFKMQLTKGTYDFLQENMDKKILAHSGIIRKEEIFQDEKDGAVYREYHEYLEEKQEQEKTKEKLQKNHDLNQKIIKSWHANKSSEIEQNPEKFYDTEDS